MKTRKIFGTTIIVIAVLLCAIGLVACKEKKAPVIYSYNIVVRTTEYAAVGGAKILTASGQEFVADASGAIKIDIQEQLDYNNPGLRVDGYNDVLFSTIQDGAAEEILLIVRNVEEAVASQPLYNIAGQIVMNIDEDEVVENVNIYINDNLVCNVANGTFSLKYLAEGSNVRVEKEGFRCDNYNKYTVISDKSRLIFTMVTVSTEGQNE